MSRLQLQVVLSLVAAVAASQWCTQTCPRLTERLDTLKVWCVTDRQPGHIVNTVLHCLERRILWKNPPRVTEKPGDGKFVVGLSESYDHQRVNESRWEVCNAEGSGQHSFFGIIRPEDSFMPCWEDYVLWYATNISDPCWFSRTPEELPEMSYNISNLWDMTPGRMYECRKCESGTVVNTNGEDSDDDEDEDFSHPYVLTNIRGPMIFKKTECLGWRSPYLTLASSTHALKPLFSCRGCRLWTNVTTLPKAQVGECPLKKIPKSQKSDGDLIVVDYAACRVSGRVYTWETLQHTKTSLPDQPRVSTEEERFSEKSVVTSIAGSASGGAVVTVDQALAALDPDNIREQGRGRAGSTGSPDDMLTCLETVVNSSDQVSQQQVSTSLKGFELFAALLAQNLSEQVAVWRHRVASLMVARSSVGAVVGEHGDNITAVQQAELTPEAASGRTELSGALLLPPGSLRRTIAFTLFKRAAAAKAFKQQGFTVNSDVVSVQMNVSGSELVYVVLKPQLTGVRRRCGYWDLEKNVWNFSRCTMQLYGKVSDVCVCSHLTHFAQLVTDADVEWGAHTRPLEALSLAGVAMSILGAVGVAVAALVAKDWRRQAGSRALLQLCGAVAGRDVLFAVVTVGGFSWAQPSATAGCVALGVCLHYTLLAAATWTTAAALLQLRRLGTIAGAKVFPHVVLVCALCSWLLPFVPVLSLLAFVGPSAGYPLREDSSSDYLCYPQGVAFYLSVVLPMALCTAINAVIFLYLVFTVLFPVGASSTISDSSRHGSPQLRRRALTAVMLFFLLGLPWLLGPPARNPVLAYIFCIVATPQGLVLFIFFVLCKSQLRRRIGVAMLSSLPRTSWTSSSAERKSRYTSSTSAGSSNATNSTLRGRKPVSPDTEVKLRRFDRLSEDGKVVESVDVSSWSPTTEDHPGLALVPQLERPRYFVSKYEFPKPESEQ